MTERFHSVHVPGWEKSLSALGTCIARLRYDATVVVLRAVQKELKRQAYGDHERKYPQLFGILVRVAALVEQAVIHLGGAYRICKHHLTAPESMQPLPERDNYALFYERRWYMFSNFSAFAIIWRGRYWMTVEHAYQAAKFDDAAIIDEIHDALSAHDTKKIAHKYPDKVRANWSQQKVAIMEELLRAKLEQHAFVRESLIATGDKVLVEDSHKDAFWGRGPDWQGENHLGKLWMTLRAELLDKE